MKNCRGPKVVRNCQTEFINFFGRGNFIPNKIISVFLSLAKNIKVSQKKYKIVVVNKIKKFFGFFKFFIMKRMVAIIKK